MAAPVPAREYHERTKHTPRSVRSGPRGLDWDNKPIPYTIYEDLPAVALADTVRPPQLPALRAIAPAGTDQRRGDGRHRAIDLDTITQLCYYAAGITKQLGTGRRATLFRAAACTGALYHIDLYLVTGGLPELPAGVYHFDPRTLVLDVLREGDYREVLAGASGQEGAVAEAPVTVVATSTWWRNAWKYGERTYRHAFWDSGTVLANLLAVGHALGFPARVVTGFADEPVADLLGIDPAHTAPLELVPVGRGEAVPEAPPVEAIDPGTRPLSDRVIEYELIQGAYASSTLSDGGAARDWRTGAGGGDRVGTREPGDGERIDLDPVDDTRAAKTPLHWTIRRRGSCREYERDILNFRMVSTVLDRATRGAPMDLREGDDPPVRFVDPYVIVHDVEGVPDGTYHYHPGAGELERLREGWFRREAGHLALDQRLAMDAGLCVYFMTDLDAVIERLGDRGYRVAQLEAAIAAGRLYLGAYAHRDLGATGLTFYDDLVTDFFSPRGAGQTPMFLWTMGRPAGGERS